MGNITVSGYRKCTWWWRTLTGSRLKCLSFSSTTLPSHNELSGAPLGNIVSTLSWAGIFSLTFPVAISLLSCKILQASPTCLLWMCLLHAAFPVLCYAVLLCCEWASHGLSTVVLQASHSLVHLLQWTAKMLLCSICAMAWKMLGGQEPIESQRAPKEVFLETVDKPYGYEIMSSLNPQCHTQWNVVWSSPTHCAWLDLPLSTYIWNFTKSLQPSQDPPALQVKCSKNCSAFNISRIYFPYNEVLIPVASDSKDWG